MSDIRCSVTSCRHNAANECKLSHIQVGKNTLNPSRTEDTECASFEIL